MSVAISNGEITSLKKNIRTNLPENIPYIVLSGQIDLISMVRPINRNYDNPFTKTAVSKGRRQAPP